MPTTRILFVCSECRLRSPTAADVFSQFDAVEALCAGTNKDCESPVTGDLIEWADTILVMEKSHKRKISSRFAELLKNKPVKVLEIPDIFSYMDPMLLALLKARVPRYVNIGP